MTFLYKSLAPLSVYDSFKPKDILAIVYSPFKCFIDFDTRNINTYGYLELMRACKVT